jgi:hypothetical protein
MTYKNKTPSKKKSWHNGFKKKAIQATRRPGKMKL